MFLPILWPSSGSWHRVAQKELIGWSLSVILTYFTHFIIPLLKRILFMNIVYVRRARSKTPQSIPAVRDPLEF